jgi:hypothetical protein
MDDCLVRAGAEKRTYPGLKTWAVLLNHFIATSAWGGFEHEHEHEYEYE